MESFGLIGVSHRRASADELGLVAQAVVGERNWAEALTLGEALLLRTCNRIELYYRCEELEPADRVLDAFAMRLFPGDRQARALLAETAYTLNGEAVAKHLFSVVCGLDSVVVGDEQIVGQFRDALKAARETGGCGGGLGLLGDAALKLSRRVRAQADFSRLPSSVAEVAAEELRGHHRQVGGARVVLLGAGEMIRGTAARLRGWKEARLLFVNRTLEMAEALAAEHGGQAMTLDDFRAVPPGFDALVAGVGADEPVLGAAELARVRVPASGGLVLDLGMPCNLSAEWADDSRLRHLDVLALGSRVEANRARIQEFERAVRPLLREGLRGFREKVFRRALAPVAHRLRASVEERAADEVRRWLAGDLAHLDPADRARVEQLGRRLAAQAVQLPLTALRDSVRSLPLGDELIADWSGRRPSR